MSKRKYHFLYKTTNLINNKFYYGMHTTSKLDDGYLGSGKMLRYSIRKYGKENFNIEILEFFSSREDLILAESKIITELFYDNPLCMNLRKGGEGGIINEEHHLKMRLGSSNFYKNKWSSDIDYNQKMSTLYSERAKKRWERGEINTETLHHKDRKYCLHTEETKEKMSLDRKGSGCGESNSQYGTCWITKDNQNKKINKSLLEEYLKDSWIKGRKILRGGETE